jgi:hemolysin III
MRDLDEMREAGRDALERGREAMADSVERGREAVADSVVRSRDAVAESMERAGDAVAEKVEQAGDAIAATAARVKPRLRGVSHEWAFFTSLGLGGALIWAANGALATTAMAIYALSLSALFGVSALYHRVDWKPTARRWMRRLDHTMIFLLIAGTFTPFALLVLDAPLSTAVLVAVWTGAVAGIVVELVWVDSPKWVSAATYVGVGLIGSFAFPAVAARIGLIGGGLILLGAALYMTGAVVYAAGRPDPNPAVFGYHEVFHVLVIAAAAAHFAAVALFALPAA